MLTTIVLTEEQLATLYLSLEAARRVFLVPEMRDAILALHEEITSHHQAVRRTSQERCDECRCSWEAHQVQNFPCRGFFSE